MGKGPRTVSSGIVNEVPARIENGVNGISEMAYEVELAKAFATVDEMSTLVPAQTAIDPEGLIVTEGACAKLTCKASGKITSKSLNHFIA